SDSQRNIQSDNRNFPKRRKIRCDTLSLQPSTLNKLIVGTWEQIHGNIDLDHGGLLNQFEVAKVVSNANVTMGIRSSGDDSFSRMNVFCRKVTQASRTSRSMKVILRA
ncbi:hypothetical protein M501DRAFT_920996, partial [Patellaria atrata CBS 101060]